MRKWEMLVRTAKMTDAKFAVISLSFLENSFIELKVARNFVTENIGTIDSEELGVVVVFDDRYVVFESGLGGVYEDDDATELYRMNELEMLAPTGSLSEIIDRLIELEEVLGVKNE